MNNWCGEGDPDGNIIGDAELVQSSPQTCATESGVAGAGVSITTLSQE